MAKGRMEPVTRIQNIEQDRNTNLADEAGRSEGTFAFSILCHAKSLQPRLYQRIPIYNSVVSRPGRPSINGLIAGLLRRPFGESGHVDCFGRVVKPCCRREESSPTFRSARSLISERRFRTTIPSIAGSLRVRSGYVADHAGGPRTTSRAPLDAKKSPS
jgi:hypothetical protein